MHAQEAKLPSQARSLPKLSQDNLFLRAALRWPPAWLPRNQGRLRGCRKMAPALGQATPAAVSTTPALPKSIPFLLDLPVPTVLEVFAIYGLYPYL